MADGTSTDSSNLIPDFITVPAPKTQQQSKTEEKHETSKPKEPALWWLNVGLEVNGKFLTLPMGIPLDKLKAKPVPNKTSDFQQLRIGEKQLWEAVHKEMQKLKPGESKRLNLQVEIRRVNEAELLEEDTNPYSLSKLNFAL